MSDPFRSSNEKQLYREAQYGLAVITCLIALFVYMAVNRIRRENHIPQAVLDAPMTRLATPVVASNATPSKVDQDHPFRESIETNANASPQDPPRFDRSLAQASHLEAAADPVDFVPPRRTFDGGTTTINPTSKPNPSSLPESVKNERSIQFANAAKELKSLLADLQSKRSDLHQSYAEARSEKPTTADAESDDSDENPASSNLEPFRLAAKEKNQFQPNVDPNSFQSNHENEVAHLSLPPPASFQPPTPIEPFVAEKNFLPLPKNEKVEAALDRIGTNDFAPIPNASNPAVETAFLPTTERVLQPKLNPSRPMPDDPVSVVSDVKINPLPNRSVDESDPEIQTLKTDRPETYFSLAQAHYDDGRFFRALYRFNQDRNQIEKLGLRWDENRDSDTLATGTVIAIPTESHLRKTFPFDCPKRDDSEVLKNGRSGLEITASERFYETREGDTLLDIARDRLGQASRYLEILEMNRRWLDDVASASEGGEIFDLTRLPAGIRLVLPPKSIQ